MGAIVTLSGGRWDGQEVCAKFNPEVDPRLSIIITVSTAGDGRSQFSEEVALYQYDDGKWRYQPILSPELLPWLKYEDASIPEETLP
jgi:hypothetical protein